MNMNDLKKGEIRPDVAKLQSRMGPYYIEAYRKFAEIKEKEGINIKGLKPTILSEGIPPLS